MTTLTTPPPSSPPAPDYSAEEPVRLVRVCAHLLPDEVIAGRRLAQLKGRLAKGLAAVVGLLIVFYGWSWWQTHGAQSDLSSARSHTAQLQTQVRSFGPLVQAQQQQAAIAANLQTVMATDLQWRDLLAKVNLAAGTGIQIGTVTGSVAPGSAAVGGYSILNQTGQLAVGTLTVAGTAPDSKSVAAFVDRLAATNGFASPVPTKVSGPKGTVAFSVSLLLTSDVLGGRFSAPPASAGTGTPSSSTQGGH